MKVITELNDLIMFDFWGGARDFTNKLSYKELDVLTQELELMFPDGLTDTQLNDIFWFAQESVCEILSMCFDTENGTPLTVDVIKERPNRWEV